MLGLCDSLWFYNSGGRAEMRGYRLDISVIFWLTPLLQAQGRVWSMEESWQETEPSANSVDCIEMSPSRFYLWLPLWLPGWARLGWAEVVNKTFLHCSEPLIQIMSILSKWKIDDGWCIFFLFELKVSKIDKSGQFIWELPQRFYYPSKLRLDYQAIRAG